MERSRLLENARHIALEIVAPKADEIDREGRFPHEAIAAFKQTRMLSAAVPKELGGEGASVTEMAEVCDILGRACSSTAMIFAMHQIQIYSMARHGMDQEGIRQYLRECVEHQHLIASVTSEVGVGGEMRRSRCGLEFHGDSVKLVKDATTISYGAYADALLVSARRTLDAPNNDQSLILLKKSEYTLEQKGNWDTMGMRGTCSPPFLLTATGSKERVMKQSFGDIAAHTMVPVSHLLWGGCWKGAAAAAVRKARQFVRSQARSNPGTVPPTALRLAELVAVLGAMRSSVEGELREYEELIRAEDPASGPLSSIAYSLKMNNLKITLTELLPQIVAKALQICGVVAYKNDSPYSLNRHLRDAYAAPLMIGNDRMLATNANLLLILKDD